MTIAIVILTYNEAVHIGRCLASISPIASEIYVIDSGSTDETVDIARAAGAHILTNPFVTQAQQFQWALDNAPISTDWVMRLDADEIIETDLATAIATRLYSLPSDICGVNLRRKLIFMGRWIQYGGRYPVTLLRIWRRGKARIEQRWMDEHALLIEGTATTFEGGFADVNLNNLTFFIDKHNRYATREAIDLLNQKYMLFDREAALDKRATSAAASGKRWLKENIYNRMPIWIGSLSYFLYRYLAQAGFLDGREGLIYHFLQAGWYRFLVAAKVLELDRELSVLDSEADRVAALERLTGYRF